MHSCFPRCIDWSWLYRYEGTSISRMLKHHLIFADEGNSISPEYGFLGNVFLYLVVYKMI